MPIERANQTGLALDELAERVGTRSKPISATVLHDWLVNCGFAVDVGGRLEPTPLGVELGEAIRPV